MTQISLGMESDKTSTFRCLKRILLSYNVIFWISGTGILGVGIWFYISLEEYTPLVERDDFVFPAYVIMVSGSTCILAGLIGWTGTVGEHPYLLSTYSGCIIVILIAEIAGAVMTFLLYDKTVEKIEPRLNLTFIIKYNTEQEATAAVDKIQRELHCCGIRGYADWRVGQHYKRRRVQREGCLFALSFWVETRLFIVGWITTGSACWQVIGLSVIYCFHKAVRDGCG